MGLLKTLKPHHFYSFLKHQNTSLSLQSPPPHCFPNGHEFLSRVNPFPLSSIFRRNLSVIIQFVSSDVTEEGIKTTEPDHKNQKTKPNSSEKSYASSKPEKVDHESLELKPFEELSPDIVLFVNRLYEEGYLKNANFLPPDKLDLINCFSTFYSRSFIRSAAERFGKDHPEILKSLSVTDLESVARFGCPSIEKRTAFAAKRLRSFLGIQEHIVCGACKLKSACKVVNQTVHKRKIVRNMKDDLSLVDIMRVLTLYGLELVPTQLVIPNEIKNSVSKLLRVVVDTSQISLEEKSDAPERNQIRESIKLKPPVELSPEIVLFVNLLYEEGYLKEANFLRPEKMDLSCFSSYYSRDFLRSAAQRFAQHHKDIKKSLSFNEVETIARFGCPSVERNTALAAKRLRSFFSIEEKMVCEACKLKSTCASVNKTVGRRKTFLSLVDIMRVLTLYGLELVPAQLVIPNEIKDSVRKVLEEVVKLSQISRKDPNPDV